MADLNQGDVVCVECDHVFTGPEDASEDDEFICTNCAVKYIGSTFDKVHGKATMARFDEAGFPDDENDEEPPHPVKIMTVKTSEGTETVYVPVEEPFVLLDLEGIEPTETESDLASEVVMELGDMLPEIDLDVHGDALQGLMEDVVLSVRESILHVAKSTLSNEDYEALSEAIRES